MYNYKTKHLPILQALKKGKEVIDIEVENALLKRALGYDYTEKTQEKFKDGKMSAKMVTKHVAPDVASIIFWLKNRRPDKWRDKPIDDNNDMMAAVKALTESNKEAARIALQHETGRCDTKC